jgi:hypothetical protein
MCHIFKPPVKKPSLTVVLYPTVHEHNPAFQAAFDSKVRQGCSELRVVVHFEEKFHR